MSEYITDAEIDEMVRRLEAHVAVDIRTALRDAVLWGARYAEVRQQSKSGGDFEAMRAALLAHFEKEGDDTACHILRCKTATMTELIGFVLHELDTLRAMSLDAGCDAERAIRRAEKAEGDLASATQPLDAEMARLNARVVELNQENDRLLRELGRSQPHKPGHSEDRGRPIPPHASGPATYYPPQDVAHKIGCPARDVRNAICMCGLESPPSERHGSE